MGLPRQRLGPEEEDLEMRGRTVMGVAKRACNQDCEEKQHLPAIPLQPKHWFFKVGRTWKELNVQVRMHKVDAANIHDNKFAIKSCRKFIRMKFELRFHQHWKFRSLYLGPSKSKSSLSPTSPPSSLLRLLSFFWPKRA